MNSLAQFFAMEQFLKEKKMKALSMSKWIDRNTGQVLGQKVEVVIIEDNTPYAPAKDGTVKTNLYEKMTVKIKKEVSMAFSFILAILGVQAIAAGIIWWLAAPDASKICWKVKKSLYSPAYGNPLGLKNGTWCPRVTVTEIGWNLYEIFVEAGSCTTEKIRNCSTFISSSLNKQYARYAVIQVETDIAYQGVKFIIDDVAANHTLKVHTPFELWTGIPTKLLIQDNLSVDLTSSGSILVAGKTRSGKTTGIISLLLQVLQMGPDHYDSLVSIIDPKCAELSVLPHVVSPDEDGGGRKMPT